MVSRSASVRRQTNRAGSGLTAPRLSPGRTSRRPARPNGCDTATPTASPVGEPDRHHHGIPVAAADRQAARTGHRAGERYVASMPLPDPPALTVGDVYHMGGWDVRYARVYALGSVGHVACSVTNTNGDRRELSSDYWRYEANGWTDALGWATATIGGGGSDGILRWSDDHDEYSAIYRLDDQAEPPALDRTNVGELTIASTPLPRTLPALVGGLRERATAATAMSGGGSVDEELALVPVPIPGRRMAESSTLRKAPSRPGQFRPKSPPPADAIGVLPKDLDGVAQRLSDVEVGDGLTEGLGTRVSGVVDVGGHRREVAKFPWTFPWRRIRSLPTNTNRPHPLVRRVVDDAERLRAVSPGPRHRDLARLGHIRNLQVVKARAQGDLSPRLRFRHGREYGDQPSWWQSDHQHPGAAAAPDGKRRPAQGSSSVTASARPTRPSPILDPHLGRRVVPERASFGTAASDPGPATGRGSMVGMRCPRASGTGACEAPRQGWCAGVEPLSQLGVPTGSYVSNSQPTQKVVQDCPRPAPCCDQARVRPRSAAVALTGSRVQDRPSVTCSRSSPSSRRRR